MNGLSMKNNQLKMKIYFHSDKTKEGELNGVSIKS
jgi:hypothetical protein